jgi:hypothetical protein
LVRQALIAVCQRRNYAAFSVARFTQTYINSHLKEGTPPYEDESIFLPHPTVWKKQQHQRKINISKETAIEFLANHKRLNSELATVFDEWMEDIIDIASN